MDHIRDPQLNEYLDQTLPVDTRRAIAAHLASCADCRARMDELQLVFTRLADLPEVRLSHDLTSGILSRLPQKQSSLWTPVFAAQVGAALGIIVWLSSKAVTLIKLPVVSNFLLPAFTFSDVTSLLPAFNLESLTINVLSTFSEIQSLAAHPIENLPIHFTLAHLPSWINHLPGWQIPMSNPPLAGITISTFVLCLLVNAVLLRRPSKAMK